MANLLTIPCELRDQIYQLLIEDALVKPATADYLVKVNTRRDPDDVCASKIRFPCTAPPLDPLQSLARVNKQLSIETRQFINHFVKVANGANLHLDILVQAQSLAYVTWLRCLQYTSPVQKVYFQIRREGHNNVSVGQPDHAFTTTYRMGRLIRNILDAGPDFFLSSRRIAKSIIIEELVIDVLAPESTKYPPENTRSKRSAPSTSSAGKGDDTNAMLEGLATFLAKHMDGFLVVKHEKYRVPWGIKLLSRIRKMKICINGHVLEEIDVLAKAHATGAKVVQVAEQTMRKSRPAPRSKPQKFSARDNVRYLTELHYARFGNPLQELLEKDAREAQGGAEQGLLNYGRTI